MESALRMTYMWVVMVLGVCVVVFSSVSFFDNYMRFSAILFPPETTFGDIYTVVIQMICQAVAIIAGTIQALSSFEYFMISRTRLHVINYSEDDSEAFQSWFGTLVNLFFVNSMIFLLTEAMNFSQTNVQLHSKSNVILVNLAIMIVYFILMCCCPLPLCNTSDPNLEAPACDYTNQVSMDCEQSEKHNISKNNQCKHKLESETVINV